MQFIFWFLCLCQLYKVPGSGLPGCYQALAVENEGAVVQQIMRNGSAQGKEGGWHFFLSDADVLMTGT